jgi:hypothetical protein
LFSKLAENSSRKALDKVAPICYTTVNERKLQRYSKGGNMIHFFRVILDGYYHILCSSCEMKLAADPTASIIYDGPCTGPGIIECYVCGVRPEEPEEGEKDEPDLAK